MKINEHFLQLKDSYLFATVGRKTAAYKAAHPDVTDIALQTVLLNEPAFKNIDRRGGVNIVSAEEM